MYSWRRLSLFSWLFSFILRPRYENFFLVLIVVFDLSSHRISIEETCIVSYVLSRLWSIGISSSWSRYRNGWPSWGSVSKRTHLFIYSSNSFPDSRSLHWVRPWKPKRRKHTRSVYWESRWTTSPKPFTEIIDLNYYESTTLPCFGINHSRVLEGLFFVMDVRSSKSLN